MRECDQDFKDKSCTLTHEGRTLQKWRAFVGRLESSSANPFRKAARFRCSACDAAARKKGRSKKLNHNYGAPPLTVLVETEGCTCHVEIRSMLPHLDTTYVPDELLAPSQPAGPTGKRKKAAPSRSMASRATRVKLEPGLASPPLLLLAGASCRKCCEPRVASGQICLTFLSELWLHFWRCIVAGLDESEAAENIFGESYGADDENPLGGEAEEGGGCSVQFTGVLSSDASSSKGAAGTLLPSQRRFCCPHSDPARIKGEI